MSETSDKERLDAFVQLAKTARQLQREYFQNRSTELLMAAKNAEQNLDRAIEEHNNPQPRLF